ncbi:MAG: hypothetical protein KDB14_21185 [Planctomycetales bacterium]|nr:hypothetical protein [Planctomycetales bacterium]
MSIAVHCACGAAFSAAPTLAGTQQACPRCGNPLRIPELAPQPGVQMTTAGERTVSVWGDEPRNDARVAAAPAALGAAGSAASAGSARPDYVRDFPQPPSRELSRLAGAETSGPSEQIRRPRRYHGRRSSWGNWLLLTFVLVMFVIAPTLGAAYLFWGRDNDSPARSDTAVASSTSPTSSIGPGNLARSFPTGRPASPTRPRTTPDPIPTRIPSGSRQPFSPPTNPTNPPVTQPSAAPATTNATVPSHTAGAGVSAVPPSPGIPPSPFAGTPPTMRGPRPGFGQGGMDSARPAPAPRIPGGRDLDSLLADLESSSVGRRTSAAMWVSKHPVTPEHRDRVANALCNVLESRASSPGEVMFSMKALEQWGNESETERLLKVWERSSMSDTRVMRLLIHIGGPKAFPKLVEYFAKNPNSGLVHDLEKLGAAIEPHLLPLLKEGNNILLSNTCLLLGRIGTASAIPHLQSITNRTAAAGHAIQQIQQRERSP